MSGITDEDEEDELNEKTDGHNEEKNLVVLVVDKSKDTTQERRSSDEKIKAALNESVSIGVMTTTINGNHQAGQHQVSLSKIYSENIQKSVTNAATSNPVVDIARRQPQQQQQQLVAKSVNDFICVDK